MFKLLMFTGRSLNMKVCAGLEDLPISGTLNTTKLIRISSISLKIISFPHICMKLAKNLLFQ